MVINPTTLSWVDPTARVDGSPFGASDFKAYEVGSSPDGVLANATALLALPTAYGTGTSPIPSAVSDLRGGPQFLHMRTLDLQGLASDWSLGIEVRFVGRPLAPDGFAAS